MDYILFGAGNYGRIALELLGSECFAYAIDNDEKKWGTVFYGLKVYNLLEKKKDLFHYCILICVDTNKCVDIEKQLNDSGINNYKTIHDFKKEIIKKRNNISNSNIQTYDKAIKWIYEHTVHGMAIESYTGKGGGNAYPEVTGYFIPTLIKWGHKDLAFSYARWLCDVQNATGSWNESTGCSPYIFDTAQVVKGLLAVYDYIPEVKENILHACDWIIDNVQQDGRLLQPDTSSWQLKENPDLELIHLYCLAPLIEAAKTFDRSEYNEAAQKILNYYKNSNPKGIANFRMLSHYYAYVIEGLVDIGETIIAKEAMEKVARLQKKNGEVPGFANVNWVCSTGLFQFAIIWFKLGEFERGKKAFDQACRLQNGSGGWFGSYYSVYDLEASPLYAPDVEISWAVKFFLDALFYKNTLEFEVEYKKDKDERVFFSKMNINNPLYRIVEQVVEMRLSKIKGSIEILDAGCGKGRYTRNLKEKYPDNRYCCFDISPYPLKSISEVCDEAKTGTLTNIPYEDNSFDVVFACESLEHAIDVKSSINEMVRVTKPNGTLLIIDKHIGAQSKLVIMEWEQYFDENKLKTIMEEAGCEVNVLSQIDANDEKEGIFSAWIGMVKK